MKKYFLIGIISLVIIFLVYSLIDSGITIDYMSQGQRSQSEQIRFLQRLLLEVGTTKNKSEILRIADRLGKEGHIIKSEDSSEIEIDGIVLYFRNDTLVKVGTLNE